MTSIAENGHERSFVKGELTMKFTQIESPAVSSPEYYPTPAPNADVIRKPLLAGRHLIILNRSGSHFYSRK
jgi:hypothetical protein